MPSEHRRVFFDPEGRRWRRTTRLGFTVGVLSSIVFGAFMLTLLVFTALPGSDLYRVSLAILSIQPESHTEAMAHYLAWRGLERADAIERQNALLRQHASSKETPLGITAGFYVNWDPNSYASVQQHIDDLTFIFPVWLSLAQDDTLVASQYSALTHDPDLVALAARRNTKVLPVITNVQNGEFRWEPLRQVLASPERQRQLARWLRQYLVNNHFAGINIDFEPPYQTMTPRRARQVEKLLHDGFPLLMDAIRQEFHACGLIVTQSLPARDRRLDYDRLGDLNDYVVVMQYDQHTTASEPGPIASQSWITETAQEVFARIDAAKVIIGIGNYGYDWPIDMDDSGHMARSEPGHEVQLGAALTLAKIAKAPIRMDPSDLNPYIIYSDQDDHQHVVYLLDAITTYNHLRILQHYRPRGAALWYLGSEDPSVWAFFTESRLAKPIPGTALSTVDFRSMAETDGDPTSSEIIQVSAVATPGYRVLRNNANGLIVDEQYTQYPTPYVIYQLPVKGKIVALTFDDGPDPQYTPKILAILQHEHIHATFFIIGEKAVACPGIVRRCWEDGNEIGNHSFTHPHIARISPWRLKAELTGTDRVIESITSRGNLLFRPPYGESPDSSLSPSRDMPLLQQMQSRGYMIVGMNIDPQDYLRPSPAVITRRIIDNVKGNHVILLHDSGGNRDNTVRALPVIIHALRRRGYRFVTVSELLGPGWNTRLFPALPHEELGLAKFDRLIFESWYYGGLFLRIAVFITIVLGLLRLTTLLPFIITHQRLLRRLVSAEDEVYPSVTVAIPAYNEARVIKQTVAAVLQSDYPDLHIIVIDDGSTDETYLALQAQYGGHPRVRIEHQENAGKSAALNRAFHLADTEIVVTIDADTLVQADTIRCLVRQFHDPHVGAVAGNVKVGNCINALTHWQCLEYISNQNFERRAFAGMDSVAIIPGAISAWRRNAVLETGGFLNDTLAEDMELTFRMRLLGYATRCDNNACAFTEAPADLRSLTKQRFRWTFGVLQTLWKHRGKLGNRQFSAFTLFVIPMIWVNQILIPLFVPFIDLAVLLAIAGGHMVLIAMYIALFFVIDLCIAVLALILDREPLSRLSWLFWQRIFFREFNWYLLMRSLVTAIRGNLVGWGKISRYASARLPEA